MPEKKEPLHGGGPIQGNDTPTIPQSGFNGNIPSAAVRELEQDATGLMHGTVILTLYIKDGQLNRYATSRERSFIPGRPITGSHTKGELAKKCNKPKEEKHEPIKS